MTVAVNSMWGLLTGRQAISGPPRYATWSWRVAKWSIANLAGLEPEVVAGGHGLPLAGPGTPDAVKTLSARL